MRFDNSTFTIDQRPKLIMQKFRILLSGPTISRNKSLIKGLGTYLTVFEINNNNQIESKMKHYNIDLLILELSECAKSGIELIERIKSHFPYVKIILIDGKRDQIFMAKAIAMGANDIYRHPCNIPLLVEKVHALLYLSDKV